MMTPPIELSEKALHRQQQHDFAKNFLMDGKFKDAIRILKEARQQHGDHIALLADLAVCHYLDGRMIEWKNYLDQTAESFAENESFLSRDTKFASTLVLGKFREEEGRIDQALQLYDKLLTSLDMQRDGEYYAIGLAQLLRLGVQFDLDRPLAEYYNTLCRLVDIESNSEDRVDILHACMLAELSIVGAQAALDRLEQILELPDVLEAEKSLAYFDLLEAFLRLNARHLPDRMAALLTKVQALDVYEKTLEQMAFSPEELSSNVNLAPGLSTANSLRLQSLIFFFETSTERQIEIRRRIVFILSGLGETAEKIWRKYLRHTLQDKHVALELCEKTENLRVGNCVLSLRRKRNMQKLLSAMLEKQELDVDSVTQLVWDAEYNESYYHRLRMLGRRLNELLYTNFGVEKAIIVDSDRVAINESIRIKKLS